MLWSSNLVLCSSNLVLCFSNLVLCFSNLVFVWDKETFRFGRLELVRRGSAKKHQDAHHKYSDCQQPSYYSHPRSFAEGEEVVYQNFVFFSFFYFQICYLTNILDFVYQDLVKSNFDYLKFVCTEFVHLNPQKF